MIAVDAENAALAIRAERRRRPELVEVSVIVLVVACVDN
jgi:hypothetical protein